MPLSPPIIHTQKTKNINQKKNHFKTQNKTTKLHHQIAPTPHFLPQILFGMLDTGHVMP